MNIVLLSSIVAVCMAVGAMFIRLSAKKPATLKKLYFHHFYEYGCIDVCFS